MIAPPPSTFPVFYQGWHTYQALLVKAIVPLSPEQLALRAAPELRTIGEIVTHMIRVRASWFIFDLHEGGEEMESFVTWDRPGTPTRSAPELVAGLETTWRLMQAVLERWTPDKWEQQLQGEPGDDPETYTSGWVIWHLIEHDLHHGGEAAITLGMYGLAAPVL